MSWLGITLLVIGGAVVVVALGIAWLLEESPLD
jgi:hypothetical protein